MGDMRSVIAKYVTVPLVAAVVLAAIAVVGLGMLGRRYVAPGASVAVPGLQAVAIVAIVGLFLFSRQQVARAWGARHEDRRIADNPHYVLYASCIRELFGGESVILSEPYTEEDLNDFRTVAERPAAENTPTPGLKRGPKNVILIVAESVGTQFLSLYGAKYKTWPKLEAESKYSVVFDNYYSHITNTANSH